MLEQGSAIAPAVIAESGARTIRRGRELPRVFSERQRRRAPGVLFTVHRPNGSSEATWCFRPDAVDPENPGHKYEQPPKSRGGAGNVLHVLPSQRHLVGDTSVPVVFVEGTKKMLSLVSAARKNGVTLLAVGIVGCWNWMADGKPIPDLLDIPLAGRSATVMFDSDMLRKVEVQDAARRLAAHLQERQAEVFVTYFEDGADGSKVGADDFLTAGGTFAELRMLTRRYRPEDFALVRLTRDRRLAAMISDLAEKFWATEWKGQGGHTDRDTALMLIRTAAEVGRPVEGGVFVPKAWGDLQLEVKVGPRTISKSITRLEEIGLIVERVKGEKPDKRGGFVLKASVRAGVYQVGTKAGPDQQATSVLHSLYAATIHPRTPRLMWSSPGSKPKRGAVKGTRKVRQSPPAKPKPAIRRPGKTRCHILDVFDAIGETITEQELADAMHRSRPRELFRRKRSGSKGRDGLAVWWIDAGIIAREDGMLTRAADWRERLDDIRRAGREIDAAVSVTRDAGTTKETTIQGAETIARVLMAQKRKGYRDHLAERRGRSAPKAEASEASAENVRRSRAKRDEHLARVRERQDEAREAAREREKRQRDDSDD